MGDSGLEYVQPLEKVKPAKIDEIVYYTSKRREEILKKEMQIKRRRRQLNDEMREKNIAAGLALECLADEDEETVLPGYGSGTEYDLDFGATDASEKYGKTSQSKREAIEAF